MVAANTSQTAAYIISLYLQFSTGDPFTMKTDNWRVFGFVRQNTHTHARKRTRETRCHHQPTGPINFSGQNWSPLPPPSTITRNPNASTLPPLYFPLEYRITLFPRFPQSPAALMLVCACVYPPICTLRKNKKNEEKKKKNLVDRWWLSKFVISCLQLPCAPVETSTGIFMSQQKNYVLAILIFAYHINVRL